MHSADFMMLVLLLIVGCTNNVSTSKNLQCLFLEDLLRRLNIKCFFVIQDSSIIRFDQETICRNLIMGQITAEPKLCKVARKRCAQGPRLLLFEQSQVPTEAMKKILYQYCDVDNIFILFLNGTSMASDYEQLFHGVYVSMNCRFLIVTPGESNGYVWSEVFRYISSGAVQVKEYGEWRQNTGVNVHRLPSIYHQRNNLQECHLRMGISNLPPNSFSKNANKFEGVVFDVWMLISTYLNVSPINVFVDTSMGNNQVNGTWLGLIAHILKNDIDLGMSIGMSNSRGKVVDFIQEIFEDHYMIFIRQKQIPLIQHSLWDPFIRPFGFNMWVAFFVSILVLTCWDCYLYNKKCSNILTNKVYQLFESFFNVLGAYCLQGSSFRIYLRKEASGRITILFVFWLTMLLYICYSGCIISILLLFDDTLAFRDLEGITGFGGYTLQVSKASSVLSKIKSNSHPLMQHLYKKYLKPIENIRPGNEEGLEMVTRRRKFGFITLVSLGKYYFRLSEEQIFNFPLSKEPTFITAIIGKNSPYKRFFNHKVTQIREAGVLKYIENSYLGSIVEHIKAESFETIEIDIVTMPFTIMVVGVGLSLIALIYEIIAFQSTRQKEWEPTTWAKHSTGPLWNQLSWKRIYRWSTRKRTFRAIR